MSDSGTYTPDTIARRVQIAQSLLADPKKPITHWAEGLNELAKGALGGHLLAKSEREQKEGQAAQNAALVQILGGGQPAPSAPSPAAPAQGSPADAIAGIESSGKYDAMGPVTQNGDRAYGKYQVMGNNVPQWTQAHLGQSMTPEQFVANPQAQDAVFKGQFGQYEKKYGPEGAAKAWFAGEGGMNNPNAKDMLGTTVAQYGKKFTDATGGQPQPQAAPQPATQPVAGDNRSQIAAMLQSTSPYVQNMGRQLAQGLVQKQLSGETPTNDQKEYQQAVKQGFQGSILDYQTKLKEAGKPVTNINQQQESEYQKATGKHFADLNNKIATDSLKARSEIGTLNKLGTLLNDPNVYQGKAGDMVLEAKRLGKALGIDVGDLGGAEAIRAIQNQFSLELRNPSGGAGMPGAMSDKDREFLQSIPPGLERTKEGNQQIGEYRKKVAERSIDVDRLRQQYVKKNGRLDEGFYQELAKFSDANPLFPETAQAAPSAPASSGVRKFNPATGKIE